MNHNDFVFNSIYQGSIRAGADKDNAAKAAESGLSDYKKNRFEKASKLIELKVKEAKKLTAKKLKVKK